jgi:HK97 family phage major capsid protein
MNKFQEFLASKGITSEVFATKSAEEMAGLYNDFNTTLVKSIDELEKNSASKEEVTKAIDELRASQMEQMKVLNEAMKEIGLSIKASTEKGGFEQAKTVREHLSDSLEALKRVQDDVNAPKVNFVSKASATMTLANVSGGNVPVEQRLAGLNVYPSRQVRLMDLVSRGRANSNIISWVYQANKDGAAAGTSEGSAKNKIDFDLVVASQSVVKQTAYIKVSTEMLSDIDFIESEINNELMRELMKRIESTAYSGDGTAPNMNGIYTVATAFAAGDFALAVDNANEVDVLVVAKNQIAIANQPEPSAILMHPTDVTKLMLQKVTSTDKRYIDRLQLVAGQLSLDGTPIVKTTLVTAGTFLMGDFKLATLFEKEGLNIQIGLDADDWTKNLRTIIAEHRGCMVVKNNDRTAFVKGTFSTCMAALETA